MAVFGLHQAHEDDPHRAIRAALGMRAALDRAQRGVRRDGPRRHARRCGSGSTPARSWSARSTSGPGRTSSSSGETVNRAARLQAAAPPGGDPDLARHPPPRPGVVQLRRGRAAAAQGHRRAGRGLPGRVGAPGRASASTRPGASRASRPGRSAATSRCSSCRTGSGTSTRSGGWRVVTVLGDAGRRQVPAALRVRPLAGRDRPAAVVVPWPGGADRRRTWPTGCSATWSRPGSRSRTATPPASSGRSSRPGSARCSGPGETGRHKAHLVGYWLGFDLSDSAVRGRPAPRPAGPARAGLGPPGRVLRPAGGGAPGRHPARGPALGRRGLAGVDRRRRRRAARQPGPGRRHRPAVAARAPPALGRGARLPRPADARPALPPREPAAAGRDPPAGRPASRASLSDLLREHGRGQPVPPRGAGEVAGRVRRHRQGRTRPGTCGEDRIDGVNVPPTLRGRAAGPDRRADPARAPRAPAGVGDRPGVLGRRGRQPRRPSRTPRDRPTRPSTGCAAARSSTSGPSRRSTRPASSCSSTRCCAT